MTPRQFAPGDRLLIEATATDDTAARLNLGQRASVAFGREDVVEASETVTEGAALKLTARFVPYSSVVGAGMTLHDEAGAVVGQLALMGLGRLLKKGEGHRALKTVSEGIAAQIVQAINAAALARPAHVPRVPGAREAIAIVIGRALIDGSRDHGLPFSERVLLRSERAHEAADAILALIANQPAAPVVANEEAE